MAFTVGGIVDTCTKKLEKLSYDISEFERRTVINDAIGGTDNAVSPGDLKICLQQQMTAFEVACIYPIMHVKCAGLGWVSLPPS